VNLSKTISRTAIIVVVIVAAVDPQRKIVIMMKTAFTTIDLLARQQMTQNDSTYDPSSIVRHGRFNGIS
jgi:hypothetical protein